MPARHLLDGAGAEQLARRFLEANGLQTLCCNFRCKVGELDLIMLDGQCLAIVEVRYRFRSDFGGPLATVTHGKRRRIIRATQYFLQRHRMHASLALRFDVIAISGSLQDAQIDWCRHAFDSHS